MGAADSGLKLAKQGENAIAASTAKEVDLLGRDQPLPKDVEETPERRCSSPLWSPRARRTLQCLFDVSAQFLVQVLPRSPELLDERIVGPRIHVVSGEDIGITSRRFDLGLEPLKILTCIRRIRKGIYRLFQRNRADLLEPAPGRDSQVRGMRRELVDKQQPASTAWRRGRDGQPISWSLVGDVFSRHVIT